MVDKIKKCLKQRLDGPLYLHSLGTAEFASQLALKFDVDPASAYLAGLLHDNAKQLKFADMKQRAVKYNGHFDELELMSPALLHAPLGAWLAADDFDIQRSDVLDGIRYHTTGHPAMTDLDKVVFIADGVEMHRDFDGIAAMRHMAFASLNRCLLLMINHNLEYLQKKGKTIHPRTFALQKKLIQKQQGV